MKRRCLTTGSVVQWSGKSKGFTLSRGPPIIILSVYFHFPHILSVFFGKKSSQDAKKTDLPFPLPGERFHYRVCAAILHGSRLPAIQEEYFYPLFLKPTVRQLPDELTLLTEGE